MYPTFSKSLQIAVLAVVSAGAVACASAPTPPPVASAPPSHAFQQAASGVTEQQGDDVVFVEQAHKDPTTQVDAPPATSLHAESGTARPVATKP